MEYERTVPEETLMTMPLKPTEGKWQAKSVQTSSAPGYTSFHHYVQIGSDKCTVGFTRHKIGNLFVEELPGPDHLVRQTLINKKEVDPGLHPDALIIAAAKEGYELAKAVQESKSIKHNSVIGQLARDYLLKVEE